MCIIYIVYMSQRLRKYLNFHIFIESINYVNNNARIRTQEKCSGQIEFRSVHFTYVNRPDVPVLRGLSFEVKAGQKVALVGQSGCGKSTTVSLVERFYDVDQGTIVRIT